MMTKFDNIAQLPVLQSPIIQNLNITGEMEREVWIDIKEEPLPPVSLAGENWLKEEDAQMIFNLKNF